MKNIPAVKLGIVAVSRDCFPISLSEKRKLAALEECKKAGIKISDVPVMVENENHVLQALDFIKKNDINALVVYLGNFGPETPETMLAQKFSGPVMFVAAAEEKSAGLANQRGDAYCGMLNASYNIGLRKLKVHIPEYPVGTPDQIADMISEFIPVARTIIALSKLKIFSFGPRPQDFLACNAPVKPLYDLGIEIMENSELDLYDIFKSAAGDKNIPSIAKDMAKELGAGNKYPDILNKLAQYEAALLNFMIKNLGASEFGIFANKCWPAFEKYFEFVPCYVNSRLASRGIPVSCEVDIYGALSQYIGTCATEKTTTLLDINNSVPTDMFEKNKKNIGSYKLNDLFMGFHCGNTASECLCNCSMKYQFIMHSLMEPDKEPNITRGTLEGRLKPGNVTIYRLQSTADTKLKAYIAQGEILDIDPCSFGGIGVFAINQMARFYRHILIEHKFPHHTAVTFEHAGKTIFNIFKMLGLCPSYIFFNRSANDRYPTENPF